MKTYRTNFLTIFVSLIMHRTAIIIAFIVCSLFCSCATRITDRKAAKAFSKVGVKATFHDKRIGDHNLHYVIASSGDTLKPTLFLVHGSPASWFCYINYLEDTELLRYFRIIAIDRPGFGKSDRGHATTVTEQAEIVSKLIPELQNGKPFYIGGHSLGGPLAVKLTAKCQSQVNGLVLLAAAVAPDAEDEEIWRKRLLPFDFLLPSAYRTCNREIWWFKEDVKSIDADLNSITCPVLIFHGLADKLVYPEASYYAVKELKNAKSVSLTTFQGQHHNIPWTRYDPVKQALMKWK